MGSHAGTKVSEIIWDDGIIKKLWAKHGIEWWEVEEAVLDDENTEFRWHSSRRHGRRLLVRGHTHGGRPIFAVLEPVDPRRGVWRCRTAWEI